MVIETIGAGAVGALVKPIIADLLDAIKNRASNPERIVSKALSGADLGKAVYSILQVKTLWNIEKETSLFEFYHPARLRISSEQEPIEIRTINALPAGSNYVIEGTAGQGKSILLRFLYGINAFEIKTNKCLPLFIELRRISDEKSVEQLIADEIDRIGLPCNSTLIADYFATGRIRLYCDGFDEIHPDHLQDTLTKIEGYSAKYSQTPIVITARPGSSIQSSPQFRVVKIDPLDEKEHQAFLEKICANKAQAKLILNAIHANDHELRTLLNTPLLLTLLVLLYRANSSIPTTLAKFYEQLFDVLFLKHDQNKPGFHRVRHTNLDETQLKRLFEAFSFCCRVNSKTVLSQLEFEQQTTHSCQLTGTQVSTPGFQKELTRTACLLIEDGHELAFIHKSVAEFYAAVFVQRSNLEFAQAFYEKISEDHLFQEWSGELTFLREIDRYRFRKYFLTPEIERTLQLLSGQDIIDERPKLEHWINTWLNTAAILLEVDDQDKVILRGIGGGHTISTYYKMEFMVESFSAVFEHTFSIKAKEKLSLLFNSTSSIPSKERSRSISIAKAGEILNCDFQELVSQRFAVKLSWLETELVDARNIVNTEESKKTLIPMLMQRQA